MRLPPVAAYRWVCPVCGWRYVSPLAIRAVSCGRTQYHPQGQHAEMIPDE